MFEVSQFDCYSYLFNKPTFISLDRDATPGNIPIAGMRIGVNGAEAQSARRIERSIPRSRMPMYAPRGQPLSTSAR